MEEAAFGGLLIAMGMLSLPGMVSRVGVGTAIKMAVIKKYR